MTWDSNSDPFGTNADGNYEIFLYNRTTDTIEQLTETTAGDCQAPRLSGDGQWIYFLSLAAIFDAESSGIVDIYRMSVAERVIERVGGMVSPIQGPHWSPAVDYTGEHVSLSFAGDLCLENHDHWNELWARHPGFDGYRQLSVRFLDEL